MTPCQAEDAGGGCRPRPGSEAHGEALEPAVSGLQAGDEVMALVCRLPGPGVQGKREPAPSKAFELRQRYIPVGMQFHGSD